MRLPAIAALICLALYAQTDPPRVIGRVVDAVTGEGVPGANITLFTFEEERYRAITDDSGSFQIGQADRGSYEVAVEKSGFVLFVSEPLQVGDGTVSPIYSLEFVAEPKVTLRGRVLDSNGHPLANAAVDLVRGPSLTYRKTTDAEGRFLFDKLGIGGYKLRAAPPANHPGDEVATYFSSSFEESSAERLDIQGDGGIDGFRLATALIRHVRGIVRYEDSRPAANVAVRILPVERQPEHVVMSFGSTFLAVPESEGTGPMEAETRTDANGAFDFPVRGGGWQIVAREEGLSGSSTVTVADFDLTAEVRLKPSIAISGVPIYWLVWECTRAPMPNGNCGAYSRKAPENVVFPIWLQSVDGQQSVLRSMMTGRESLSDLKDVVPGRFILLPLPARASAVLPPKAHTGASFPIVQQIDSRALTRAQPVNLDRRSKGLELGGGGHFDGDGILPPFRGNARGIIRGTVVDGAGAKVVIAYRQGGYIWGQIIECNSGGSFITGQVDAGDYGIAAFHNLDLERLRDPEILRTVFSSNTVRVSDASTSEIRLTPVF